MPEKRDYLEMSFKSIECFANDGKLDVAVFRRATGVWYIIESSTGNPRYEFFGAPSDAPAVGDYDGDGKADTREVVVTGFGQKMSHVMLAISDGAMRRAIESSSPKAAMREAMRRTGVLLDAASAVAVRSAVGVVGERAHDGPWVW